ncbi:MAG TPA: L-threonylcarbamoyladenylate synthase [Actinomycetota bacterium]|jgi:tRNA threonylcarbamoyl adenosine modification protein (Sua5/YciO/YrdC/YwlC family)|nr:L-threonylcarbamoyladenylate synthase [Actinomycetota bacterium]
MSELFELTGADEQDLENAIDAAARAVTRSMLVVLPTDTVYGIGARPDRSRATGKLFAVKRRSRHLTLPVLAASADDAASVALLDDRARTLGERFWPGGLTLILLRGEGARGWRLGDETETVGVRVPDHPVALELLRRTGPLAVTSANLSGEPTPSDCRSLRALFGQAVAVYLCAGLVGGLASSVVDLSGPTPQLLREGSVPSEDLLALLE